MSESVEGLAVVAAVEEKLCRRCNRRFDPSKNTPSSCSFHPSFFVCRHHDDQKRYYELGPDDPPYAAKFYDCCGAEDPDASGSSYFADVTKTLAAITLMGRSAEGEIRTQVPWMGEVPQCNWFFLGNKNNFIRDFQGEYAGKVDGIDLAAIIVGIIPFFFVLLLYLYTILLAVLLFFHSRHALGGW